MKGKLVPAPAVTPITAVVPPEQIVQQPQAPDISKMSVVELKALERDQMILLQQCQQNIQVLEQEINKRG